MWCCLFGAFTLVGLLFLLSGASQMILGTRMAPPGKNKQKFQECFSRMNFLYQASVLMAGKNNTLSSYYGELCKNVGKKSVLRIEPTIKRTFCKRCSVAQQPGITSELVGKDRNKCNFTVDDNSEMLSSCKFCGYKRKFITNTKYKFWLESPESIAEICTQNTEPKTRNVQLQPKKYQ